VEFLRKKNKYRFESVGAYSQIADEEFDWEGQAMYERQMELVNQDIEQTMEQDQDILYQKYILGLSIKKIQEKFNLSESAVKMRLQRARNKIGKKIQYPPENYIYSVSQANIA
jgi:RNA polymerase sigma-70 factor (ECF subfamily)